MNTLDDLRDLLTERADHVAAVPRSASEAVHRGRRARVRRRNIMIYSATLVAGAVTVPVLVSSLSSTGETDSAVTVPLPHTSSDDIQSPPDDGAWRWESYGGIELQVPASWGYGTSGSPWCAHSDELPRPVVGRPGPIPAIACADAIAPVDRRVPYAWLGSGGRSGTEQYDHGWIEETRLVGEVQVTVLTQDDQLRARILESARVVADVDVHGCPVQHAIAADPAHRPNPSLGGLATLGDPIDISACTYAFEQGDASPAAPLLASSRITGASAVALIDALVTAPEGIGPDDPGDCISAAALGDQALVLRVSDAAGTREAYVRYDGCEGHGVDDGVTSRMITAAVGEHALADPHAPSSLSKSMFDVLRGDE